MKRNPHRWWERRRTMKSRTIRAAIAIVLTALAVVAGFPLALRAHFRPVIPDPDYPPPASREEAWSQDLDYFEHYLRWNRPYTDRGAEDARRLIDELREDIDALSDSQLELGVARAVALSNNGHSTVWIPDMTIGVGRIPMMGRMFADGYYFLWSAPEYESVLGLRLVTIDGTPVEDVIAGFRPYSGAREGLFRLLVGWFLETPGLVHALGFSDSPTGYTLGLQRPGEDRVRELEVSVPGPTLDHPIVGSVLVMRPSSEPWWTSFASDDGSLPWFLQNLDDPFSLQVLPEIDGLYVRYTANEDVGAHSIEAFNEEVESAVVEQAPSVLIVDQRLNGGGDYTLTVDTMRDLPDMVGGDAHIYVLTSPLTFSAGISSVAFLEAEGGDRVAIVGEEIGDHERMWGETTSMTLPNSGLGMSLATGLHDYRDGCHEFPDCYWLDFFNNVAVGSLSPDIRVPFTFADYAAGTDAALEVIIDRESGRA